MKFTATDPLNVRSGPSITSSVVRVLAAGDAVDSDAYAWKTVTLADGTRGYCAAAYLRPVGGAPVIPLPTPASPASAPTVTAFLVCPIQSADESGHLVTSRTVRISAVIDHSGTAIDPTSTSWWGLHAKDQKVTAFNGEVGDGEASATAPYGYTKRIPGPFFAAGEINYVGAHGVGDTYGPSWYLNYDGHAGYDFAYSALTPVVATAGGVLQKATDAEDVVYGQGWNIHHTFYVQHPNGYSTWYRHCTSLADTIEARIGSDFSKTVEVAQGQVVASVGDFGAAGAVHLHLEVRDAQGRIVDPYGAGLWEV